MSKPRDIQYELWYTDLAHGTLRQGEWYARWDFALMGLESDEEALEFEQMLVRQHEFDVNLICISGCGTPLDHYDYMCFSQNRRAIRSILAVLKRFGVTRANPGTRSTLVMNAARKDYASS